MNKQLKLLLNCALSALCLPLYANTYTVSPTGNDINAGTEASPWATLRKGLSNLTPGDTLIVHGGEYQEILGASTPIKINPGTQDAPIVVKAAPGERPVLRGLLWLQRPSYWTLDGINVTWQDGLSTKFHMVRFLNGVGWTFKNAEVWGAHSVAGILVAHTSTVDLLGGANEPSDWRVAECVVHDTYPSNDTNQDQLIYVNTGLNAGSGTIERNILYNATNGNGVKLGGFDSTQGTVNVTVRYNTIYNTTQGVLVSWLSANNQIYRNMFDTVADNYGFIRGYQLVGTGNTAHDNGGNQARYFVFNDDGYLGIQDVGNTQGLGQQVTSLASGILCFPPNPAAATYGRFATEATSA